MNEKSVTAESQGIRWGLVSLIAAFTIVGILGPKLLWMNSDYATMVRSWPIDAQFMIHPTMRMLLVLVAWLLVLRLKPTGDPATMGLMIGWERAIKAIVIGLGCTLPMLALGLASELFTPARHEVLYKAISPGLTEEIFFRAFFFGMLVQAARCPMWWCAVITGIVFGLAHVDLTPAQGQAIAEQLNPWIALISIGGFMYAWLYWESRWNLWLVIALHTGMNLWWDMFDLTATPLGDWGATGSRFTSVGLVVLFVVGFRALGTRPGATISHEHAPQNA